MRFLVDEAMQDAVADRLVRAGHDAVHVRQLGLGGSPDEDLLDLARAEQRVLLTLDSDFGTLLALSGEAVPSVILLRGLADDTETRVAAVLAALTVMEEALDAGAVATISPTLVRVRPLPIE